MVVDRMANEDNSDEFNKELAEYLSLLHVIRDYIKMIYGMSLNTDISTRAVLLGEMMEKYETYHTS